MGCAAHTVPNQCASATLRVRRATRGGRSRQHPSVQIRLAGCPEDPLSISLSGIASTIPQYHCCQYSYSGFNSFRFELNLSSSAHRVTQLNPECVMELLKLGSNVNECKLGTSRMIQRVQIMPAGCTCMTDR